MEDNLPELAHNIRIDHWPPHLGVKTDEDKREYLASLIERLEVRVSNAEESGECDECWPCANHGGDDERDDVLQEKIDELTEEVGDLEEEIDDRKNCEACEVCTDHQK